MSPDIERRLRHALGERDRCRGQIMALLRKVGFLRLLRMRTPPSHRPLVDGLTSLLRLEAELNDAIEDAERALEVGDDEVVEE